MERETLRNKLNQIQLPVFSMNNTGSSKIQPALQMQYEKILNDLHVKLKDELFMLRTLVSEKIGQEQERVRKEVLLGAMSGRYSFDEPEKIPLYRTADGNMMVSDKKLLNLIGFIAYLNEVLDNKYPGAKMSTEEAVYTIYLDLLEHCELLPGSSCMFVVKTDETFRLIMDRNMEISLAMLTSAITDFTLTCYRSKATSMNQVDFFEKYLFPKLYEGIEKDIWEIKNEEVILIDSATVARQHLEKIGVSRKMASAMQKVFEEDAHLVVEKTSDMVKDSISESEFSDKPHEFVTLCLFNNNVIASGEIKDLNTIRKMIAAALKPEMKVFMSRDAINEYLKLSGNTLESCVKETLKYIGSLH